MNIHQEIEILSPLVASLKTTKDLGEKQELLLSHLYQQKKLSKVVFRNFPIDNHDLSTKTALFSIYAIGQEKRLFSCSHEVFSKEKLRALLKQLVAIDHFYESIGGIAGYHLKVLELLVKKQGKRGEVEDRRAPGVKVTHSSPEVIAGIRALPEMGEIYPIGGLGSRLNLLSKRGDPLPAACLPFLGRTLLEGLVRDVQAREFLYFRLFRKQVTVPIAMMTSLEKRNAKRVRALCEKNHWFGRSKESFFLFSQLSVPVISKEGQWVMRAPLEPLLQPGGHGALWRTAEEQGVFVWFKEQEKQRLLVRQINNPIGGIDSGLLALIGVGKQEGKAFGFASCERLPHAAEGVLVLRERAGEAFLTNVEYTDFKHLEIKSDYPANTNILYADIHQLQPVIKKTPLPGLMVNMKQRVPNWGGKEVFAGRLESMMQNISDALKVPKGAPLSAFVTYNARQRTISTTKKSFEEGSALTETPEGAFYDLLYSSYSLLKDLCGFTLSPFCNPEIYMKEGPSHLFLYHPALGPLFSLIQQKICRGKMEKDSELQLEIADVYFENLDLAGSLLVRAHNIMGHDSQGILRYSQRTGKCVLKNVAVKNAGIQRSPSNCYWKNQIKRTQSLTLILEGHSEFYAENVTFNGNQTIIVPDGERWIASQNPSGAISFVKERAGWEWNYTLEADSLRSGHSFS